MNITTAQLQQNNPKIKLVKTPFQSVTPAQNIPIVIGDILNNTNRQRYGIFITTTSPFIGTPHFHCILQLLVVLHDVMEHEYHTQRCRIFLHLTQQIEKNYLRINLLKILFQIDVLNLLENILISLIDKPNFKASCSQPSIEHKTSSIIV